MRKEYRLQALEIINRECQSVKELEEGVRQHLKGKDEEYKKLFKRYEREFHGKVEAEFQLAGYRTKYEILKKKCNWLVALNVILMVICLVLSVLTFI